MLTFRKLTTRQVLILVHDLIATALALLASFFLRFETIGIDMEQRLSGLTVIMPGFLIYAGLVFYFFQLYRTKWRFVSVHDLAGIIRSSTLLALSLLVLDYVMVAPNIWGSFFFGKLTILLFWLLEMLFLAGSRVGYRWFRYTRERRVQSTPTLLIGRAHDADVVLRAVESGAASKMWPIGILSQSPSDRGQSIRGVPVLGAPTEFENVVASLTAQGKTVARVVLMPSGLEAQVNPDTIVMQARRLGLSASRLPSFDDGREAIRLAPVNVEDLLLRPAVKIDYNRLESFIGGKSVIVTGGGGSIGTEVCDRVVTYGAARLLVIENSEPALHAVLEMLNTKKAKALIEGRIADVRDRERIFRLTAEFKPDIVFHAAALKHVPLLEQNWDEGVKTNVFGSINVADAAAAAGAFGMVMISTDKAIEPVSVLGSTKRLAEMYCQALDKEISQGAGRAMRLISVRFGNVLASNGSVVPRFKAQIEAGGPVTVTHPDMVRYFMTIREACDLVVTAASHALGPERTETAVYVLNMGQPVKIVDLAERMIRLSGLEPGKDIDIVFTGIRPGERLHEILFAKNEENASIGIDGVVAAKPVSPSLQDLKRCIAALEDGIARENRSAVYAAIRAVLPDFGGAEF